MKYLKIPLPPQTLLPSVRTPFAVCLVTSLSKALYGFLPKGCHREGTNLSRLRCERHPDTGP